MISSFNKKSITITAIALCLIFMAGCSSTSKTPSNNLSSTANTAKSTAISTKDASNTTAANTSSNNRTLKVSVNISNKSQQNFNSQNILLQNIKTSASKGKIINCNFAVYTTSIQSIEGKLGKADKEDFVPQIKNSKFYSYSKYNVVFGVKRGQVFEVRSFDNSLKQLSLSAVKKSFGNPVYSATVNGEKIIGYETLVTNSTAKEKYKVKIEFAFSKSANGNSSNPILNHYFVLDPRSTADDMANDPGIQW